MPKYTVIVYHETYSDYEIEADSEDQARDLVMGGEAGDPVDTTVMKSEIINCVREPEQVSPSSDKSMHD